MSVPVRRRTAAHRSPTADADHRLCHQAATIRYEWLSHGLCTDPADRPAAEQALTRIYARLGRPAPRVRWDPELSPVHRPGSNAPWPVLPAPAALDLGAPVGVVLHQAVRVALHRSLGTGLRHPVRAALAADRPVPVCWYGQHDAAWIGYYDALHRLGLARYRPERRAQLAGWADLARSCGWWWPGERVCVVTERPTEVRTEPVPGSCHDEVRLRTGGFRYRDGWEPGTH